MNYTQNALTAGLRSHLDEFRNTSLIKFDTICRYEAFNLAALVMNSNIF